MTTNIKIEARPYLANDGRQLEVLVQTFDNDVLVNERRMNHGDVIQDICVFEGRRITIEEVPIDK